MVQIWFACEPGSISVADIGARRPVYMVDDQTVSIDDLGGQRVRVGSLDRFSLDGRNDLVMVNVATATVDVGDHLCVRMRAEDGRIRLVAAPGAGVAVVEAHRARKAGR